MLHAAAVAPLPIDQEAYDAALAQGYTGRWCDVRITHIVRETPYVPAGYAALSIRRCSLPPAVIATPGSVLTIQGDDHPDPTHYPGYAIAIDGHIAAVVEWPPDYQAVVVRSYAVDDDTPRACFRWDTGEALSD